MQRPRFTRAAVLAATTALRRSLGGARRAQPSLVDPNLGVRTVASGLVTPSTMAFIGPNDFLVLEKNTGAVKRVTNSVLQGTVLDLSVNFGPERGCSGSRSIRLPDEPGRLSLLDVPEHGRPRH